MYYLSTPIILSILYHPTQVYKKRWLENIQMKSIINHQASIILLYQFIFVVGETDSLWDGRGPGSGEWLYCVDSALCTQFNVSVLLILSTSSSHCLNLNLSSLLIINVVTTLSLSLCTPGSLAQHSLTSQENFTRNTWSQDNVTTNLLESSTNYSSSAIKHARGESVNIQNMMEAFCKLLI